MAGHSPQLRQKARLPASARSAGEKGVGEYVATKRVAEREWIGPAQTSDCQALQLAMISGFVCAELQGNFSEV
jgi:hypothetical protein